MAMTAQTISAAPATARDDSCLAEQPIPDITATTGFTTRSWTDGRGCWSDQPGEGAERHQGSDQREIAERDQARCRHRWGEIRRDSPSAIPRSNMAAPPAIICWPPPSADRECIDP